jgi:hypothetical protein
MKRKRQWVYIVSKPPKQKAPSEYQDLVNAAISTFIKTALESKYFLNRPTSRGVEMVNIYSKWYQQHYIYFIAKFHDARPNAINEIYENHFARMAYIDNDKFDLAYMRHTEQWCNKYKNISFSECLDAIRDDDFFTVYV